MSQSDASFNRIREAIVSLFPSERSERVRFVTQARTLLLQLPTDVAAFSVLNGHPQRDYEEAYGEFRQLYRERHREWDALTISFVVCRSSSSPENDRFFASLEHDPLFCRKYVIHSYDDLTAQKRELLRLPFLPLPENGEDGSLRAQSAQDLLQGAGLTASLARKIVEARVRSADRIVEELRSGEEAFPKSLVKPDRGKIAFAQPRAYSRIKSATLKGFRAYRKSQDFDLDASVVVLYGPNGLGKTSFFDAIDYACTGRIGRLCRDNSRSQEAFAELATHLDEPPGTGSVVLRGKTANGSDRSEWSLERATGNWSTAWINNDKMDRRDVLAFLTHATWIDSKPRQQAFESLFRATHLFGQDEQEMMVEFRKNSVIPDVFISEMLALQDYSQGIDKANAILKVLREKREALASQLGSLREEAKLLAQEIDADKSSLMAEPSSPIDDAFASFIAESATVATADFGLPTAPDRSMLESWREMAVARSDTLRQHIGTATRIRQAVVERPTLDAEIAQLEQAVATLVELRRQLIADVARTDEHIATTSDTLRTARSEDKKLAAMRADLRTFLELRIQRQQLIERRTTAANNSAEASTERAVSSERLETLRREIAELVVRQGERNAALENRKNTLRKLTMLIETNTAYTADRLHSAELISRLKSLDAHLQALAANATTAQALARAATESRATHERQSKQEETRRSQLQKLLDAIASHVHTAECPVCGTAFDSVATLLDRLAERRTSDEGDNEAIRKHDELLRAEALAAEASLTAVNAVSTSQEQRRQIAAESLSVAERLEQYESSCKELLGEGALEDVIDRLRAAHLETAAAVQSIEQELFDLSAAANAMSESLVAAEAALGTVVERQQRHSDELAAVDLQLSAANATYDQIAARHDIGNNNVDKLLADVEDTIRQSTSNISALQSQVDASAGERDSLRQRIADADVQHQQSVTRLANLRNSASTLRSALASLSLPEAASLEELDTFTGTIEQRIATLDKALDRASNLINALEARERRSQIVAKNNRLTELKRDADAKQAELEAIEGNRLSCEAVERLLKNERQASVATHIKAYGPLITNIQQRLRSVYGFGGVHLEARGGDVAVEVEWRDKIEKVPPTDFFSDSQKQILMLSIFLAGGLRQNWSGFAPVLLDDPVTHFDDLNAYGFVEMIRGIISSEPTQWQFIISTCEERLFALMQKKFARAQGGARFLEFVGMTEEGPIIERRD